eukprot:gene18032-biopygen5002
MFNAGLSLAQTVVLGIVVGQVVAIMQQADINSNVGQRMLETVSVLEHLGIPQHFRQEILGYQNFNVATSNQLFDATLQDLPQVMKDRMELYSQMKVLRSVLRSPDAVPDICVARLAQALVTLEVPPDEFVIVADEEAQESFILHF